MHDGQGFAKDPRKRLFPVVLAAWVLLQPAWLVAESVDLDMVNRIRYEGYHHSQVMALLGEIADGLGPRLTASPQKRAADTWAMERMKSWGLVDVHRESFEFGRGWSMGRCAVYMIHPRVKALHTVPMAWTPGTRGPIRGEAMAVSIHSEDDFDAYAGKLKGRIVLLDAQRAPRIPAGDVVERYGDEDLRAMVAFDAPASGPSERRLHFVELRRFMRKFLAFLAQEGAAAVVTISDRDAGVVEAGGFTFFPDAEPAFPILVMAAEPYNQVIRMLNSGTDVELELDLEARFHDEDGNGYNLFGDIPGSGRELVMLGAHFDSWHAADGAIDNGSGSAVVLEAIRILRTLGVEPRRTIRVALWSGEEQGHIGSRAYVDAHFATRPEPADPYERLLAFIGMDFAWPITVKPEHGRLSVYFNLDGGSGRIRGIFGEENAAARPIFETWFGPFQDLGAATVTLNGVGGTDHQSFDAVGLPGFQFIQDRLDYETRLHHSNLDTLDRAVEDDLKQAAVIMASFVYHAASRDERFPRKPIPEAPPDQPR